MIGIYKIQNTINGKVYIGKSKNIMQRWTTHEFDLINQKHHSKIMQKDFNEYGGIKAFDFSVVETCTAQELNEKEQYYIKQFDSINSGYNANCDNAIQAKDTIEITYDTYKTIEDRLGSSYLITYLYILFHADDKKQIILNQSNMADYFGVNTITISKHIKTLLNNGIIKNVGKKSLNNIYEVC